MDEIERASNFCHEKLLDQKERLGENHCCIGRTLKIMVIYSWEMIKINH